MIRNNFSTALRSITKNKGFSFLNIVGLALGISCALLILLWVQDELRVDQFHANGDELYQVYQRNFYDGKVAGAYQTQGLLAQELKKNIPEIEYASGMEYVAAPGTASTFSVDDNVNKMMGFFVGADFLNMFSYPVLQGDKQSALTMPNAIAISRKMADLFFGSTENAIGKTIRFENKGDLQVTAVFENLPVHASQQFDFLRGWGDFVSENAWVHNWGNTSPSTFVQLRADADRQHVAAKIKDFIYHYTDKNEGFRTELALQPYGERYLYSNFKDGYITGGRIEYVRLFSWVAAFVLLIACINFMNLATARSVKRAKEIGLRKTIGASRFSLITQFYMEAFLLAACALLVGLILAFGFLPVFNQFTGKALALPLSASGFWLSVFALLITVGMVAGSYPALYLSSMRPIHVLKNNLRLGGVVLLRKGLVVFQFTLSVMLILGMMVIYRQLGFIQTTHIGYDRENLVYIPIEGDLVKNYQTFKTEAENHPGILSVSKMRNSPTVIEHHTGSINWQGKDPNLMVSFADAVVGYDFAETLQLQLKEGRDFSKAFGADSAAYLLNETAVERMGFQSAIGQTVDWGNRPGKIIGILRDFHFNSFHQAIEPLIIRLDENWTWGTILVRTKAGSTKDAIATLERLCKALNPKTPFTFQFSDLEFSKLYKSEEIVGKLSYYFALFAILISCLGLFGLAAFTAEQRTKEVGIRKVLGASVGSVVSLLSQDFVKLVLVAIVIACPIAWWTMNNWLAGFAYRIDIEWWMFAAAGLAAVAIALLTVSFQAIKAAVVNPVDSLRDE
ncbi:ABC transporter permease [Parapedobacter pyrenivorans]|uniref:ABC transporter permease n=1 Tax=Parapedobacter pyrenivorans TaxID=1305674 RepID=A0A917HJ14_9SPHI|nr:ABC transporter permease [Parapedobacter pyrenivorans]GGG80739.1 ABC transporter permease [Parapedobacter pyrenivorans]